MPTNPWRVQPVAIGVAIRAIVMMCSVLWWHLEDAKLFAIYGALEAVIGIFTYQTVTTPATLHAAGLTVGQVTSQAADVKSALATGAPMPDPIVGTAGPVVPKV